MYNFAWISITQKYYRLAGAVRVTCKGHKAWIPPKALRAARLGIAADLTLGSIGCRSLQVVAWMEVSNVFGSFFDKFTATN